MIKKRIGLVLLLLAFRGLAADSLLVFKAGDTARAAQVNANFKLLMDRVNALSLENQAAKKSLDSVKTRLSGSDGLITKLGLRADSLNARAASLEVRLVAALPIRSVIASTTAPVFDYLPNSDQTWLFAAGQTDFTPAIPDLRGVFIRGINIAAGGKSADLSLDKEKRLPGEFQEDEFKKHYHAGDGQLGYLKADQAFSSSTGTFYSVSVTGTRVASPINPEIGNFGGTETRPKNVALYYYIKVK